MENVAEPTPEAAPEAPPPAEPGMRRLLIQTGT